MTLINEVLDAAGGLHRWNALNRFVAYFTIDGALIARNRTAGPLEEMVAEGSTHAMAIRLGGFPSADCEASLQSGRTRIEQLNVGIRGERIHPRVKFDQDSWDELDLAYFCCVSIWNCMTAPFVLVHPGVTVEEVPSVVGEGGNLRRLHALFPPDIATYATEQTYHFDDASMLRRIDHHLGGGGIVSDHCSAHQEFSGIVIPTLRRAIRQGRDDIAATKIAVLDVEVFGTTYVP